MRTAFPSSCASALGIGVLALVLAWSAEGIGGSDFARRTFVDAPLRTCAEHDDGPADYNAARLAREFERLPDRLRTCGIAIAVAAFGSALALRSRRLRFDALAAVLLCGGLVTGAAIVSDQTAVLAVAVDRGMAGSTRAERFATLYPQATRAAETLAAVVPADARVLVVDFADPDHLHAFGYIAFPIRVYTPNSPELRFDAATFRALLRDRADVRGECAARRYVAAVDLRALVAGDARGIVRLNADGTERP